MNYSSQPTGVESTGHKRQREQSKARNEQNYIQLSSENISPCIAEAESCNQYHKEFSAENSYLYI